MCGRYIVFNWLIKLQLESDFIKAKLRITCDEEYTKKVQFAVRFMASRTLFLVIDQVAYYFMILKQKKS